MHQQADDATAAVDNIQLSIEPLINEANGRSISRLLALHGRERLFVHPLLWDHRQPALLQCRFLPLESASLPLQAQQRPGAPLADAAREAKNLRAYPTDRRAAEFLKRQCPEHIYEYADCRYNLRFHFGRKPLGDLGHAARLGPSIAYITRADIWAHREALLGPGSGAGRYSVKLNWALRRRYPPPESQLDPYVAAVCIGLAYSQRWGLDKEDDYDDDDNDEAKQDAAERDREIDAAHMQDQRPGAGSRETTTNAGDVRAYPAIVLAQEKEHVSVFAAHVSAVFLDKLDEPKKRPAPGASMDIRQRCVTFRPYKTFSARLAAAVREAFRDMQLRDNVAGKSRSVRGEERDSSLLCIRQHTSSVDSAEAGPGEMDMKRKHSNAAGLCKPDRKENQSLPEAKRRREEEDILS